VVNPHSSQFFEIVRAQLRKGGIFRPGNVTGAEKHE
jgi:hypothetical protein